MFARLGAIGDATGLFSEAEVLSLFRVLGSSLGRIADAALSLFLTDVESPHRQSGGAELPLTKKVFEAVSLLDGFMPTLDPMFRRLLLQAIERHPTRHHRPRRASAVPLRRRLRRSRRLHGDLRTDVVDRTVVVPARLRRARLRRVNAAGARVVKLIGDEVMFVATNADAACRAAEALMSGFDSDGEGSGGRAARVAASRSARCSSVVATTTARWSTSPPG